MYIRARTATAQCGINSIIRVYVATDFETKLQLKRERDEIRKLLNEIFSLRMDVLYKLSLANHVSQAYPGGEE